MRVVPIPCLSDNYAYLLVCPVTKEAALVDVSEPEPVLSYVRRASSESGSREQVKVVAILSTHHHHDHVGGNGEVKTALGITRVYGHSSDRGRIPGQTEFLEEGDRFDIGSLRVDVLHVPGHTTGAVAYVVNKEPEDPVVFTGDTLFVAGCGRIFEGTPPMMYDSLSKLASLDGRTRVFCGHEYTEANLAFAAHVEPSNQAVQETRRRASTARKDGRPTVPSTIAEELAVNPFFRPDSVEIRRMLSVPEGASSSDAFAAIRRAKNEFRG